MLLFIQDSCCLEEPKKPRSLATGQNRKLLEVLLSRAYAARHLDETVRDSHYRPLKLASQHSCSTLKWNRSDSRLQLHQREKRIVLFVWKEAPQFGNGEFAHAGT